MKKINLLLLFLFVLLVLGCETETHVNHDSKDEAFGGVLATGVVASSSASYVGPPLVKDMWQYKIKRIVSEGKSVKQGDFLVAFDDSQLRQKLMVKKSELEKAKKNFENELLVTEQAMQKFKLELAEKIMNNEKAQRKWQQSKDLSATSESLKLDVDYKISSVELEQIKHKVKHQKKVEAINLTIAKGEVERLTMEVKTLKAGIAKLVVKSPKDGMVVFNGDYQGDKPVVGDSVWGGRALIELPSMDSLIIKASIDEVDARKVKLGQSVEIAIDAVSGKSFLGEVIELGKVFHPKSKDTPSIVFDAVIRIANGESQLLRPGMNARIKILSETSRSPLGINENVNQITAPESSLQQETLDL